MSLPATDVKKSVLIIDDHPLFRKGVRQLLEMDGQYHIVGEAADGKHGLQQVGELRPDLVLLDLNMAEMNGLQVLEAIKQLHRRVLVVIITVSDQDSDVARAIHSGADGYLLKDMEPEDMLEKLGRLADGQVVLDDNIALLLANILRSGGPASPEQTGLTAREVEILQLLVRGLNNKLIARELDISDGTVKVHVKNILRKLKVKSRLEAAVWAMNHDFPGCNG
ncbi:MAG: two-component system response regulator NarL [Thiolinea sp.]